MNGVAYSQIELDYIKQHYKTESDASMAIRFNRTKIAITAIRQKYKLFARKPTHRLTDQDKQFLLANDHLGVSELARILQRPASTVNHYFIRVRRNVPAGPVEHKPIKPIPKDWKPSVISAPVDPNLIRHVDLLRRVYGTYGGARNG
jgi:hypothetical protein